MIGLRFLIAYIFVANALINCSDLGQPPGNLAFVHNIFCHTFIMYRFEDI